MNARNKSRGSLLLTDITLLINYAGEKDRKNEGGRAGRSEVKKDERERNNERPREGVIGEGNVDKFREYITDVEFLSTIN